MAKEKGMTYKDSGVDINAGNETVRLIKKKVESTFPFFPGKMISPLGGFCAVMEHVSGLILGASTDGVGTKLKLAKILNKHTTIGIDLVAMCFNDLLPYGIWPGFFLDYYATGKLNPKQAAEVVRGIADGCVQSEAALVGGETAEMPGFYGPGEYDLAGFAVGFARSKKELITGEKIRPGAHVYGLPSLGMHANGYSLARKVYEIDDENLEEAKKILDREFLKHGYSLGEELLTPTKIYVKDIKMLTQKYEILGGAHITGGGLEENPPRILPDGCAMEIEWNSWPRNPIFEDIQERGRVSKKEMRRTFNNGIGFILISFDKITEAYEIGRVVEGKRGVIFI
jgi:phosphoribosylformylglycinamidine cyclo-ligase